MIFQNCLKFHEPFTTYNNFEICLSLRITISKYHSSYLCQTSLQIMLLPIQTSISVNFYPTMATDVHELGIHVQFLCDGPDCFSSHRSLLFIRESMLSVFDSTTRQKLVSYIRSNNYFVCQHKSLSHPLLIALHLHT